MVASTLMKTIAGQDTSDTKTVLDFLQDIKTVMLQQDILIPINPFGIVCCRWTTQPMR
jgi:hypothetical protein